MQNTCVLFLPTFSQIGLEIPPITNGHLLNVWQHFKDLFGLWRRFLENDASNTFWAHFVKDFCTSPKMLLLCRLLLLLLIPLLLLLLFLLLPPLLLLLLLLLLLQLQLLLLLLLMLLCPLLLMHRSSRAMISDANFT